MATCNTNTHTHTHTYIYIYISASTFWHYIRASQFIYKPSLLWESCFIKIIDCYKIHVVTMYIDTCCIVTYRYMHTGDCHGNIQTVAESWATIYYQQRANISSRFSKSFGIIPRKSRAIKHITLHLHCASNGKMVCSFHVTFMNMFTFHSYIFFKVYLPDVMCFLERMVQSLHPERWI